MNYRQTGGYRIWLSIMPEEEADADPPQLHAIYPMPAASALLRILCEKAFRHIPGDRFPHAALIPEEVKQRTNGADPAAFSAYAASGTASAFPFTKYSKTRMAVS